MITPQFTPEEAHNNLVLIDLALKNPNGGGIAIMVAAHALVDKINAAVTESQRLGNELAQPRPAISGENAQSQAD